MQELEHFPSFEQRRSVARNERERSPAHSAHGSLIRSSLVKSQEKRMAKKVRFYRNGDKYFHGMVWAISVERFRTWESLLADLTRSPLGDKNVLPNGVRYIFSLDGERKVSDLSHLREGESYVCSSTAVFKNVEYVSSSAPRKINVTPIKTKVHNGYDIDEEFRANIKPKLITVIRNGSKPRRAVRVLLNKKTAHSLDQVMGDVNEAIRLDSGAVRKMYTLQGKQVTCLQDLFCEDSVFIAYGLEKYCLDDFDLDDKEVKFVSAYKSVRQRERVTLKSPKPSRRQIRSVADMIQTTTVPNRRPINGTNGINGSNGTHGTNGTNDTNGTHYTNGLNHNNKIDEIPPNDLVTQYKIGKQIGHGNYAIVKECTDRKTNKAYALKIISKAACRGQESMMENEVNILRRIQHSNVVQLITDFTTNKALYLIVELITGGDLFDAIASAKKYTERDAGGMLFNLCSALHYLHSNSIVHRDVKPENLFVNNLPDGSKILKLGDFGLATEVKDKLFTVCGTPTYVAPEILAETGYGTRVDVWSAGVITYILLCGYPPFSSSKGNDELFEKIMKGKFQFQSPYWDGISNSAKELIISMIELNETERFTAMDVLNHPWVMDDREDGDNLNIKSKLHETIANYKTKPKNGADSIATVALDKKSCFFESPKQLRLTHYENGVQDEMF